MNKKSFLVGIAVLLLLLAGLYAPGFFLGPSLKAVKPEKGRAVQVVYATGSVEASVMVPIAARSAARLVEMNADEGSAVKKDEQLARLEDTDVREALQEAMAREEFASKAYQRMAALVEKGSVTRRDFDQARADWDAAKATVSRLRAQADYMKLVAPADGTIVRRDGEIGQLVTAGQNVFWMTCCAPLRIAAEVDEEDIPLVTPGQEVLIRADAFPGKIFKGKVTSITPKGDAVTRSYRVRISLEEDTSLKIGMTAEANIIASEKNDALLIPRVSISNDSVWRVKNGTLERVPVTLGIKGLQQVEVLEGLGPDDIIIETPNARLREGLGVRPALVPQEKGEKNGARNKPRP